MKLPTHSRVESNSNNESLYFRAVDRLRLEGYVSALTQEGMSLSMVSTQEAILDHYGKILVGRLRQAAPDVVVEIYFPASSEALLARFNEVLVNSSIQEAMNGKVSVAAPRIWLVHDASALPNHEIELLARLVQHFPAANIRVVLLMTAASQKSNLLTSFGRSILCWDIEPPTPDQVETMLAQARTDGREAAAKVLLKKMAIAPEKPAEPGPKAAAPPVADFEETKPLQEAIPRQRWNWRWLLGGIAMLLISALSVAFFYVSSQGSARLQWHWQALLSGNNPMTSDVPAATALVTPAAPLPVIPASASAVAASAPVEAASNPVAASSAPAPLEEGKPKEMNR